MCRLIAEVGAERTHLKIFQVWCIDGNGLVECAMVDEMTQRRHGEDDGGVHFCFERWHVNIKFPYIPACEDDRTDECRFGKWIVVMLDIDGQFMDLPGVGCQPYRKREHLRHKPGGEMFVGTA